MDPWGAEGGPSGWAPDELVRRWLCYETEDQQLRFDAGFLVNSHLMHEHEKSVPVTPYTPLCVPQMATGGVVMGTLYGGRPQFSQKFPLETEIRSRFCLDFRTGLLQVYLSHLADAVGLIELGRLDTDAVGDIVARVAVFEAGNPAAVHFGFNVVERKICTFCAARDLPCECLERMRRSALPDLPGNLRQEYGAVSHTRDFGMNLAAAATIMQKTMCGRYQTEVVYAGTSRNFTKWYDVQHKSEVAEQARIRYAQALAARRRPRALPSILSDGSSCGKPGTSESDSGSPAAEPVDDLSCALCGSRFTRKSDAQRHARTVHLRERHFPCPTCGRKFIHKTHLRDHVDAVHERVTTASCPECEKMFTSKSKVNRHLMAVHKKIKLHACDICGRSYSQRWALKRHAESHLNKQVRGQPISDGGA